MKESDRVSGKKVISLVDLPKAFRFLGPGWFVVNYYEIMDYYKW